MNYKLIITLLLCGCLGSPLTAQKVKKKASEVSSISKFSKRQVKEVYTIKRARSLMEKSPERAIEVLESVLRDAYANDDVLTEAEAYMVLGEIYENTDQASLAIKRYAQAIELYKRQKGVPEVGILAERMARLYLNDKNSKSANIYYEMCVNYASENSLALKCKQGMYDVKILQKDTVGLIKDMNTMIAENPSDSLLALQNYARISQVNVQQNDFESAYSNFAFSVNSLPREITKEDYVPVQRAMDELLAYDDLSTREKIDIRNKVNIELPKLNPIKEILVTENMKIAELYLKENRLAEAEKFINASIDFIDSETPAATTADVFKKSAEIAQQKGKMEKALEDLDKYIKAKETSIKDLESQLQQQINIVTGQQRIDLNVKDISLVEKDEQLVRSQLRTQKIIIGLLSTLLLATLVFFYFLYKNIQAKREVNQKLLLKSLRTQMNPHFIFNALNSVNNFIAKNDEKAANKFLSDFSRLMRKVLDYSQKDFITFEEEIELNELYLKLEHFRFRDKFTYQFQNNIKDQSFDLDIPPMLIQPFIENAVWHGLRYKEDEGKLTVSIDRVQDFLVVKIVDDGIGREKSKALKTKNQRKYKSMGLENIAKRIALINEVYHKNYKIEVEDVDLNAEDVGTCVQIYIPIED